MIGDGEPSHFQYYIEPRVVRLPWPGSPAISVVGQVEQSGEILVDFPRQMDTIRPESEIDMRHLTLVEAMLSQTAHEAIHGERWMQGKTTRKIMQTMAVRLVLRWASNSYAFPHYVNLRR